MIPPRSGDHRWLASRRAGEHGRRGHYTAGFEPAGRGPPVRGGRGELSLVRAPCRQDPRTMRAPRAKPSSEIVDLALERTGRSRSVDAINSGKLRLAGRASGAGKTSARQKPLAELREGRPRRTGNGRSGSIAEATGASRTNLAEMRVELSGARDQMGELEAETGRLRAQLFRLTQERRDTERGSLELSLRSLAEELGNALAERSAADLRAERTAQAMEELSEELAAAASERDGLAAEREQAQAEAAELRGRLDEHI